MVAVGGGQGVDDDSGLALAWGCYDGGKGSAQGWLQQWLGRRHEERRGVAALETREVGHEVRRRDQRSETQNEQKKRMKKKKKKKKKVQEKKKRKKRGK